ncbi:MAG TPA: SpoIIE family protein phosphatase [Treponemataceae bacterium]|nr:SpoIIE family protein phosphatase [Treponemataceae bacterium]
MLKTKRRIVFSISNVVSGIAFILITFFLAAESSFLFTFISAVLISIVLLLGMDSLIKFINKKLEYNALFTGETSLLTEFAERLRTSYSGDDFIETLQVICEDKADMGVLYVDRQNNYVLYNSPDRITTYDETERSLKLHFPGTWEDGYYYFDDDLGLVSDAKKARGFFFVFGTIHLYFFCRYTHLFEFEVFLLLYEEFIRFASRSKTIRSMSKIAELSAEWNMLAETQRSFLPQRMPDIDKLDLAPYFRPLVNVSGDYYTVLPITEKKTLVMLGDVSGKGLAAALVMGLVMNVVKIMENKEDLKGIVRAIDIGIKRMNLDDKYTVLFIGVIDTEAMNIRYINASMSDPLIVTKAPDGFRIKLLPSNCSVVGILDLPELVVDEMRLYRDDLILMASDGVSEVMDDDGIELGDTDLYMKTIEDSAVKSSTDFVSDIADLVMTYNGDKKLRDDVTMLVVKIGG